MGPARIKDATRLPRAARVGWISVLAGLLGIGVGGALTIVGAAGASQQPQLHASVADCSTTVTYTVSSPDGDDAARTNGSVGVWWRDGDVGGFAPDPGELPSVNALTIDGGFTFTGTIETGAAPGSAVTVRAAALEAWGDGAAAGEPVFATVTLPPACETAPAPEPSTSDPTAPPVVDAPDLTTPSAPDVPATPAPLVDEDGVPAEIEAGAPNGGDGNADGFADSEQAHVASLPSALDVDGNGAKDDYVTIAAPEGTSLANVRALRVPADNPPPDGATLPAGLFDYDLAVANPGDPADVELFLPDGRHEAVYMLQDGRWREFDAHASIDDASDRALLHLVDGGAGDESGVDGVINDPVGVGTPGEPGTITAHKVSVDANGQTFGFRLRSCTNSGASASISSCSGASTVGDRTGVAAGDYGIWNGLTTGSNQWYFVSEINVPSGFGLTSVTCSGGVNANSGTVSGETGWFVKLGPTGQSAQCTFTNASNSITARKGGVRVPGQNNANTYVSGVDGATFEVATNSTFTSGLADLCTTSSTPGPLGTCTVSNVTNGTKWVREKTSPAGWDKITTVAYGGGPSGPNPDVAYNESTGNLTGGTSATTRWFMNRMTNPPLAVDTCGLKIGLLLDKSQSISGFQDDYIEAAQGFVSSLANTPTQMKLWSFGINAQTYNGGSFYDLANGADVTSANTQIENVYNNLESGTNWDVGLQAVGNAGLDVLFVITDGNPIMWQGNTSGTTVDLIDVEAGVASANLVKSFGQRVVSVGVGNLTATNISLLSGPTQGSDYFVGSVAELQQTLNDLAKSLCGGSLTVKKEVKTGPGANDFAVAPGWAFNASPAATTVTPANGQTGANGTVNFDYAAGPWPKAVTVTETQQTGYSLVQQGGQNAACTVDGSPATVQSGGSAGAPNVTLEVDANDIVACTFRNSPATSSIQVRKETTGGAAGPFQFTVTGPNATNANRSATTNASGVPVNAGEPVTGLFPGSYTITESSLPAGWELTDIACTGATDDGTPDLEADRIVVGVGAGQQVICTFTNSSQVGEITIVKQAIGGVDTFPFDLSQGGNPVPGTPTLEIAAGPATPADDGTDTWTDVAAGTYAVSEQLPAGWTLTGSSCDDGSTLDAVEVSPGETVTCTVTNTKLAEVTIEKVAVGAGAGSDFDFSVPTAFDVPDDTLTLSPPDGGGDDAQTFAVPAGSYPVTELGPPAGWDLTGLVCDDGSPTQDATATIDVVAGEAVTCTWTNTKRGTVTVVKRGVGAGADFDFDVPAAFDEPDDTITLTTPTGGGDDSTSYTVAPGTYPVSEQPAPDGWDLTDVECTNDSEIEAPTAQIAVAPGEDVTCTWTNTKRGELEIVKDGVGEGPGAAFEFTVPSAFDEPGNVLTLTTPDGGGEDAKTYTLPPATYVIDEAAMPAGWDFTGITCDAQDYQVELTGVSVALQPGESASCTWTNTKQATIDIVKEGVGAGPGAPFDFDVPGEFTEPNDTLTLTTPTDGGDDSKSYRVPAGTYPVTEQTDLPGGWDFTALSCSNDSPTDGRTATIQVEPGEEVTCTWTNTKQAEITITKVTVGEGEATFDFAVPPAFGEPDDTLSLTPPAGGGSAADSFFVPAGEYTVAEEQVPDGWDFTSLTCTNESVVTDASVVIEVGPGEQVTCTWTNTQRPENGNIVITKVGVGAGDGAPFGFSVPAEFGEPGDTLTLTTPAGGGNDSKGFSVPPDTEDGYVVSEVAPLPAGWDFSDLECTDPDGQDPATIEDRTATIFVSSGETVTCTWTNTKRGDVTVEKVGVGAGAGATFDFSVPGAFGEPDDTLALTTPTDGGSDSASYSVAPGTYAVTETVPLPDGWDFTDLECTNGSVIDDRTAEIEVAAGESVTCTWTNTKLPGTVTIAKTAVGESAESFQFSVPPAFGAPDDTVTLSTPAGGGTVESSAFEVPEGTYPVSELGPPAAWDLTDLECTNDSPIASPTVEIQVPAGGEVTCTWTNTERADVTIEKVAIGSGPGATFQFSVPAAFGEPDDTLSLQTPAGGGEDAQTFSVPPGSYAVSEQGPPSGWRLTGIECSNDATPDGAGVEIEVAAGATVTCTWTNEVTTARVEVVKQVGGSDVGGWTFDGQVSGGTAHFAGGGTAEARTTAGSPPLATFDLEQVPDAGAAVLLAEQLQVGYGFAGVSCAVIAEQGEDQPISAEPDGATATPTVLPDQVVRCTFVNNLLPASISLVKTASASQVTAGSDTSFSIVITNDGQVPLTNVVVTDPVPTGTTFVSATVVDGESGICSEAGGLVTCTLDGTLEVGETSTISLVVNVPASATPFTIVNSATVTGDPPVCPPSTDEPTGDVSATVGECPVTSTDDATVPVIGVGGETATVDAPRIVAGTLPFTGPAGAAALKAGAWLLALGGVIQLSTRRRRPTS